MLATVALVTLVAPLPWLGVAAAARRLTRPPVAARVVASLVGALVALVTLRGLALTVIGAAPALAMSVAAGLVAGWIYLRAAVARFFAGWLLPAVVVVPALFLADPGISRRFAMDPSPVTLQVTGSRVPVVVIVFDELSLPSLLDGDDGIDRRRFPHFAALAEEATWFRNAAAPSADTSTALPAILTGRVSHEGDPRQSRRNLFTLLGDYPAYVIEPWSALCPRGHNRLAGQHRPDRRERIRRLALDLPVVWTQVVTPSEWRRHLPPLSNGWDRFALGTGAERRVRKGETSVGHFGRLPPLRAFLDSIAPAERALYFGHLFFPHAPWEHLPSGRLYSCKPECHHGAKAIAPERWRAAQLYQRYLLQAGYTDAILGDAVARLRRAGLYERALLVVLADHGLAFRPGLPRRSTLDATLADNLGVPLLVKLPGQRRGVVDDEIVSTADMLATVADVLRLEPEWPVPGRSLLRGGSRAPVYVSFAKGRIRRVPADFAARRIAARDRLLALLGEEAQAATVDPWRIGPFPQLVGRRVAASGERARVEVTLDREERYADVDPAADDLPLIVSGTLHGARRGDECCAVAVAVDETVWATTHSFEDAEGDRRVVAMVPPRALRRGTNVVSFFAVDDDGVTLHPIARRR